MGKLRRGGAPPDRPGQLQRLRYGEPLLSLLLGRAASGEHGLSLRHPAQCRGAGDLGGAVGELYPGGHPPGPPGPENGIRGQKGKAAYAAFSFAYRVL